MKKTDKKITRREAIEKTGKYAALTAAATFLILSPKQSQANSPTEPGWGKNSQPEKTEKNNKNLENNTSSA